MMIKALFFGLTADLIGSRSTDLDLKDHATPAAVLDHLAVAYPEIARHRILIAVNEEYVPAETLLRDGDELAIFTAVSGG
ncbi:MAG: MoaD/ThiS family protein [Acidobacteriota bacterium]